MHRELGCPVVLGGQGHRRRGHGQRRSGPTRSPPAPPSSDRGLRPPGGHPAPTASSTGRPSPTPDPAPLRRRDRRRHGARRGAELEPAGVRRPSPSLPVGRPPLAPTRRPCRRADRVHLRPRPRRRRPPRWSRRPPPPGRAQPRQGRATPPPASAAPAGRSRPASPTSPTSTTCAASPSEVEAAHDRVDVLVHNAGALTRDRTVSPQGIETTVAAQVRGAVPAHHPAAPAAGGRRAARARVLTMSSGGMYAERLDVDDLEMGPADYDGVRAYARAKRAQVELTAEWAAPRPRRGGVPRPAPRLGRHPRRGREPPAVPRA